MSNPSRALDIVIPVYNGGEELFIVLKRLALQPDIAACRVIVVDDGSMDDTAPRLAELDYPWLEVVRQPNLGRAAARNTGLARARSELVVFLDADIAVDDGWLGRHLHARRSRPEVLMGEFVQARGSAHGTDDGLYDIAALFRRFAASDELAWVCVTAANLSLPRQAALDVGGFDTAFCGWGPEDVEFAFKLERAGLSVRSLGGPPGVHLRPRRGAPLDRDHVFGQLTYFFRKHPCAEVRAYIRYVTGSLSCEELYAQTTGRPAPQSRTYFRATSYFGSSSGAVP